MTAEPLTALEWLRVTHADTLSGRRIEEAVATARADERQRWTTAVETLAEELQGEARICAMEAARFVDDGLYRDLRGRALGKRAAAARLRAAVAAEEATL